jgi:hypothetical protein
LETVENPDEKLVLRIGSTRYGTDYRELILEDLRQAVYLTPIDKIPDKLKKGILKFADKRRKPVGIIKVPLGAAGDGTEAVLPENLFTMSDPYPQEIRNKFTDNALTDPTAAPALKKRTNSFFANGYTLKLMLKSARAADGHLLTDLEKQTLLQTYEQQYLQYVKKIEDWDNLPNIKTLTKLKNSRKVSIVQGRALVKMFPGISKLAPGQLPLSLKFVASEDMGAVIIDRQSLMIVAVRVISFDSNLIILPDEMIYCPVNDSGLKKYEMFFGRSEMEPIVQLCSINKRAVNYEYAKAIVASYQPKIVSQMVVEGTPEEKDIQLKKRAQDLAAEGLDVMVVEANPDNKTEVVSVTVNHEMMSRIRADIDMLIISNMGATKLQLGRVDGLTRDNATIMEIENIRNVRTPDENDFADFFESQLYNPLLAHLAQTSQENLPMKIIMVRNKPMDEASIYEPSNKQDLVADPLIPQKGQQIASDQIAQADASSSPFGAAGGGDEGSWITTDNGTHIHIIPGESKEAAIARFSDPNGKKMYNIYDEKGNHMGSMKLDPTGKAEMERRKLTVKEMMPPMQLKIKSPVSDESKKTLNSNISHYLNTNTDKANVFVKDSYAFGVQNQGDRSFVNYAGGYNKDPEKDSYYGHTVATIDHTYNTMLIHGDNLPGRKNLVQTVTEESGNKMGNLLAKAAQKHGLDFVWGK